MSEPAELFDNFIVCRSGFLQNRGSAGSGVSGIALAAAYRYGGKGTRTRVDFLSWDANPRHYAEYVHRWGRKDRPPRIIDISYSWGVGYGFVNTARALGRYGLDIDCAVLCDGVHHCFRAPWRAFLNGTFLRDFTITIPGNVAAVMGCRQTLNYPRGHDWEFEGRYTREFSPVVLPKPHTEIDNAREFRSMALSVCEQLIVEGRKPGELECVIESE